MPLKRQEIYILFYVASALSGLNGELGLSGGPFGDMIWTGYLHMAPQSTVSITSFSTGFCRKNITSLATS